MYIKLINGYQNILIIHTPCLKDTILFQFKICSLIATFKHRYFRLLASDYFHSMIHHIEAITVG